MLTTAADTLPVRVRGFDRDRFIAAKRHYQIPHAFLFHGEAGLGKLLTAKQYAAILLCQTQTGELPCGHCQSCRLQRSDTHPDYQIISPEEAGHAIKIDQIRSLIAFLQQTPQQAGFRVVIITPADALNHAAANSLLKLLEEPGENTVLFLVSDRLMSLPATLKSRCVKLPFLTPAHDTGRVWPTEGHDADFLLGLRDVFLGTLSPVELAQRLNTAEIDLLLVTWLSALHSLICHLHGIDREIPPSWAPLLNLPAQPLKTSQTLFHFIDALYQARSLVQSSVNPNQLLLLENLLIKWYRITQS
ncbi:MAG: holB [Gammaproteobacteria bacterium]|jgi:DNA polymerase-3 subunit delta'|nr:holB [Gammaproteobacteria bacterium]